MNLCIRSSTLSASSVEFNYTLWHLNNSNNRTLEDGVTLPEQSPVVKLIFDGLILVNTIIMLTAMGCTLTKEQLLQSVKRPIGISIGMFCQFVILPLLGFSITKIIAVDDLTATGILLVSCCPGGMVSNVITYYCDGDVSLSVAMTSSSTLMAMGLMPLNLWMYGRHFGTGFVSIPYAKLATALLMVTSPVLLGMVIRWKWPRVARIISKVGSFVTMAIITVLVVLIAVWFPNMFVGGQSTMHAAIITLPFLGLTLGYVSAAVLGQTRKVCKTVAIESGFQNGALAMAMIALSFPLEQQVDLLRIPILYGLTTLCTCTFICILYQTYKKCSNCEQVKSQDKAEENKEHQEQEEMDRTI